MAAPAPAFSVSNVDYKRRIPNDGYAEACLKPFENNIIKFTTKNEEFNQKLMVHFKLARYHDLHNILTGVEQHPIKLAAESQVRYDEREDIYGQRQRLVLNCLQHTLANYLIANGIDAQYYIDQLDGINDPHEYNEKIRRLTSSSHMVDNISSVMDIVDHALKRGTADHAQDYKTFNALQTKVLQIQPAITVQNICSILYMHMLPAKFSPVVTEILGRPNFTSVADTYKMVHALAQQQSMQSAAFSQRSGAALSAEVEQANLAVVPKTNSRKSGGKGNDKGGGKASYGQGQARGNNYGGHSQGQGGKSRGQGSQTTRNNYSRGGQQSNDGYKWIQGQRFLHNYLDYPDGPTEYERQLKCLYCALMGHAVRTCNQRIRDERGGSGGRQGGRGGRGRGRGRGRGGSGCHLFCLSTLRFRFSKGHCEEAMCPINSIKAPLC